MTSPTATITGRIVGPDGLGRLGRITFTPVAPTHQPLLRAILTGRASFRIDPDGYLVGPEGQSAAVYPGTCEIDLNIPGDSGVHLRRRVELSPGQVFTLADLLSGTYTPPQPPPAGEILTPGSREVRPAGSPGALEAANPVEVVDLGDGTLTWRKINDGLIHQAGRGVQDSDTPGILEAIDKAAVIDLGNGALTWR